MDPNIDFNFFLPLSKVEKQADGSCIVAGYASTPALDLDGEIVSLDAVRKALPGYWQWRNIREMHTPSAVGVAKEANIDDKGLFLTSRITDAAAVQKCLDEVYKGYSIGGRKLNKTGNTITEIELVEVSLVDRPANPECRLTVQKSAKAEGEAYLVKVRAPKNDLAKALNRMSKVAEHLAKDDGDMEMHAGNPPAARDGFSLPAKKPKVAQKAAGCAAHGMVGCSKCSCAKHAMVDCAKCAAKAAKKAKKLAKREFDAKERESAASSGAALPDGSFPIKDVQDLKNAIQAIGRVKDPGKAKAHIKSRAKALGQSGLIPDTWKGLTVDEQLARFVDNEYPDLASPKSILKRMGVAGNLAYCFDALRDAQRSLLLEGSREGGDKKDKVLAQKLGTLASGLAAVIGQKAEHEGAEALDLSDADDIGLAQLLGEDTKMSGKNLDLDAMLESFAKAGTTPSGADYFKMGQQNFKKARMARKEAAAAVADVHAMHKAGYLSKLSKAKKPSDDDADDFDHEGAMHKLQKAHAALTVMKTFSKAAENYMAKASGNKGPLDGESYYRVPAGVESKSNSELASAGPGGGTSGSAPPMPTLDQRFPGKAAKGADAPKSFTEAEVELIKRAERAEAERDILAKLPSGPVHGRRPAAFDISKITAGGTTGDAELYKDVNPAKWASADPDEHNTEVGKVIGNMIAARRGKSVFDTSFHGTAGTDRRTS